MATSTTPLNPFGKLTKRDAFLGRLTDALENEQQTGQAFAVFSLNLDHFRKVNYTLGYVAGDRLIFETATRLEGCLSAEDVMTHLAGDEFAILITNAAKASETINAIHSAMQKPFSLRGQEVYTTLSIGVAYSNQTGVRYNDRPEHLLRDANLAMYQAQKLGEGQFEIFDQKMKASLLDRFQLEGELRQAIAQEELRVFYQPVVALGSGEFKGFEALVRWQHPRRGFIPADTFINVAEETGLIVPLGNWVLNEACNQARGWQIMFGTQMPLAVNVNFASKQFWHVDMLETVTRALLESGLEAANLRLEIKESTLVQNVDLAAERLSQLKALGVQLHLDDFGSEAASLGWLHRFPLDVLTINPAFLNQMMSNKKAADVVYAIVALGHNLGMGVVAKGVETDEQLTQIKDMKFDYVQGYFLSEPLDSNTATDWITEFLQTS